MPRNIRKIRAETGQSVSEGETLLIMEAMKMELAIKAPMDGEVSEIAVAAEDIVEADTLLLALEPKT